MQDQNFDRLFLFLKFIAQIPIEIFNGIIHRRIPWIHCSAISGATILTFILRWDLLWFQKLHITFLYPRVPLFYVPYFIFWGTWGFWIWALAQTYLRQKHITQLKEAFHNANLINNLQKMPAFINDHPIDDVSRKLRLTSAGLTKKRFEQAKEILESNWKVFIEEISEIREKGVIEIHYSHLPMPMLVPYKEEKAPKSLEFIVGESRTAFQVSGFRENPHLLVAGQTGGGKSTFLRQMITHLYINNKSLEFTLIDLKGGLEFALFENLERITVAPDIYKSISELEILQTKLEQRMKLIRSVNAKDLDGYLEYLKKQATTDPQVKIPSLNRHVLVIDEAAEMFLGSKTNKSENAQNARTAISQIARLGRAVGVHLVVATQRPDSRALDPQVKANLTGVLCFRMQNDASSISVLGTGRATDLPKINGRAIWREGMDMIEVQTPYLSLEEAETLLIPYRKKSKAPSASAEISSEKPQTPTSTQPTTEYYKE